MAQENWSDGASFGISAPRALETILGGKESPKKEESMSPAQMREYLRYGPVSSDGEFDYDGVCRGMGDLMLRYLDEHPEAADLDMHALYDLTVRGHPFSKGCTGFMVGWAFNAAKYARGEPPQQNPALVTFE